MTARDKDFLHEDEKKAIASFFTKGQLPPKAEVEVTVKWVEKNGQYKYAHIPIPLTMKTKKMEKSKSTEDKESIVERMRGKATIKDMTTDEIMRMTRGGEW